MISSEHLGPPNLQIAGLQLWIHGIERIDPENWLRVTAHCGAQGADVWTSGSILMVHDIVSLRDGCQRILKGEADEFALSPLEPEIELSFRKADDLGHYDFSVRITPDHMTQKHEFEFSVDQSYLQQTITACETVIATIRK